ncbi:hypothetical protein CEXT_470451 [Caerostris extrusa]|uniref:Amino acid transporter transmembrane domain-containing protein n=1 Tax=Caerostris extrusa TaxID=172846 RepID=A0AAV4X981_CAEEX|nr:hypothetical protein CEXT_470451 [Caerostris extrusa]
MASANPSSQPSIEETREHTPLINGPEQARIVHYDDNQLPPLYDDEDDDDDHRDQPQPDQPQATRRQNTTKVGAFLHLIKGNIGTGILAMPIAISNFGLVASVIGILVLGSCSGYCMWLLVYSSKIAIGLHISLNAVEKKRRDAQEDRRRRTENRSAYNAPSPIDLRRFECSTGENQNQAAEDQNVPCNVRRIKITFDYAETAFEAFKYGPQRYTCLARPMRFIVNLLLILTQFGFCCAYYLFVGQSIHEVSVHMQVFTGHTAVTVMAALLPLIMLLNFIPDLEKLALVSSAAVLIQAIGLVLMISFFVRGPLSDTYITYIAPYQKWPLFFGTAMFSFEGIGVVLPVENQMKKKRSFIYILTGAMTAVTVLYIVFGSLGYVKYGSDVEPSITFNLPIGGFSEAIRLMFALAILFSYPLQMHVPFTFILPFLKKKIFYRHWNKMLDIIVDLVLRMILVSITFGIAVWCGSMLDTLISFVGSLASSLLALVLPPLIHWATIDKYDIKYKKLWIGIDISLALLGLSGMGVGVYTSIWEMAHKNITEEVALFHSYVHYH